MAPQIKVIAFGEIIWDIIEGEHHLGGAPLNFAAHSVQCGAQASIISRLGKDTLGLKAIKQVKELGVDTTFIQLDTVHPTGTVEVMLVNGQPDYDIRKDVAHDFIQYEPLQSTLKGNDYDVFYFGTLAQRSPVSFDTLSQILKAQKFRNVFFDVNLRKEGYTESIIQASIRCCNILKLNTDEVVIISALFFSKKLSLEEFCRMIAGQYPVSIILITAGDKGCFLFHEGSLKAIEGMSIELCDGVGAGDAFSASFMFEYLKHGNAVKAAKVANQIGAFVASKKGPIPAYSKEIRNMLALEK